MIWKLDRLGRTVKGLVDFVADLQEREIQFRSLTDGIDTTTPAGRFFFHIMASLAQMERELLAERTRFGRSASAGLGRRPQAADGPGESGIGPQALEGWDVAPGRGRKPRRLDPDAVSLGARIESMNHQARGPGRMLNISPDEDRCFLLRCYRNPSWNHIWSSCAATIPIPTD